MENFISKGLHDAIKIDDKLVVNHLNEVVLNTVEQTLNGLLDAEADRLCGAERFEHTKDRLDTRAGSYERKLETKAGEVTLSFAPATYLQKYNAPSASAKSNQ